MRARMRALHFALGISIAVLAGEYNGAGSGLGNRLGFRGNQLNAAVVDQSIHEGMRVAPADANVITWDSLGLGIAGTINAMVEYQDMLFVGGGITDAGSVPANNIAA